MTIKIFQPKFFMTPQDRELFTLIFCSTHTLRFANPDGTFKDLTMQQMARLLPTRFPGFKQKWIKFFLDTSGLRIHKKLERADAAKDKELTTRLIEGRDDDGVIDNDQSEFLTYYISHAKICWNFYCAALGCANEASKHCAKCKVAHYCSRQCQVQDFPTHKVSCPDLRGFDRQEHLGCPA